jgi:hypothetical protein
MSNDFAFNKFVFFLYEITNMLGSTFKIKTRKKIITIFYLIS